MQLGTRMLLNILCEYLDKIRKLNVTANWILVLCLFISYFGVNLSTQDFVFPETSEPFKKYV